MMSLWMAEILEPLFCQMLSKKNLSDGKFFCARKPPLQRIDRKRRNLRFGTN